MCDPSAAVKLVDDVHDANRRVCTGRCSMDADMEGGAGISQLRLFFFVPGWVVTSASVATDQVL